MTLEFSMRAVAASLEAVIRSNRPIDMPVTWQDEILFPHYESLSIYNVAQTILDIFDAEASRPLDPSVWNHAVDLTEFDRIVLIISDGLGYQLLNEVINDDGTVAQAVHDLTEGRGPLPLTSVLPTTTAVALPTLWTGVPAVEHGMIGTSMFLRELSMLSDVLFFRPTVGKHPVGSLNNWGLDSHNFVTVPSIAQQLESQGVSTHLLLDYKLNGTGLSNILHRGVKENHKHMGLSDFWLRLRDIMQATRGERAFVHVYWPVVDGLSHGYGYDTPYVRNEIREEVTRIRDLLAAEATHDGRTLVMLIADHGHYDAPTHIKFGVDDRTVPLKDAMRLSFGGGMRLAQMYLRAGTKSETVAILREQFAQEIAWVGAEDAVRCKLFGPGEPHPEIFHRLGDLILVPRQGIRLIDGDSEFMSRTVSIHGGLTDREMLVPFIWKRI